MLAINNIYNNNFFDVFPHIDNNSVDLTITSPPYDNIRGNIPGQIYTEATCRYISKELFRVTKTGGIVIYVVADQTINGSETGNSFTQALIFLETGWKLNDTMIYTKNNPRPTSGPRYQQSLEYMFCFSKETPKTFNAITETCKYTGLANMRNRGPDNNITYRKVPRTTTKKISNIFNYSIGGGISTKDKCAYGHPAIFPEKLVYDQIVTWSNIDDLVFDPMCGSGTVCKIAKQLLRKYLGIEIITEYCNIAKTRIGL